MSLPENETHESTKPNRHARRDLGAILLLTACALLPYAGTWSHDFVGYDDRSTIVNLPLIRNLSLRMLPEFFQPRFYPGLYEYMPLKNLSYAVDYALFGLSAPGFRLQQQAWYVLSVLTFFFWLRALLRGMADTERLRLPATSAGRLALATSALFALHPAHVESVTWLSGRKDVLCGTFMMAALLCAFHLDRPERPPRRWLLPAALVCTALALLSKPMAVVLPLLVVLQDHLARPARPAPVVLRERGTLYAAVGAMALAFAVFYATSISLSELTPEVAARLYRGPSYARIGQQLIEFGWLTLVPAKLAPMLPPDLLDPSPTSLRAWLGYAAVLALLVAGTVALWRRHPLALALGLFVIPLLPILITPPWAQYVAGRYLFHALAGALLAALWMFERLATQRPHLRRTPAFAVVLLAVSFTFNTLDYNRDWNDTRSLWLGSLAKYPRFTALHKLASHAALEAGDPDTAAAILATCLEVAPNDGPCNGTLGILVLRKNPKLGERLLRRALPSDTSGEAHLALARYMADSGREREAVELYQGWLDKHPATLPQIEAMAELLLRAGLYTRAYRAARQALSARVRENPAAPPPSRLLQQLASAPQAAEAAPALQAALARCSRVDCVQRALGW